MAVAVSDKLYKAGKYKEYKEKYLMRARVDKISLSGNLNTENIELSDLNEEVKKEEIFVDMTETGTYEGEGEFTIKGKKQEAFEMERDNKKDVIEEGEKIRSINNSGLEFDLISASDHDEQLQQISKIQKKIFKNEKPSKPVLNERPTKNLNSETAKISGIDENLKEENSEEISGKSDSLSEKNRIIFDDIKEIDSEIIKETEKSEDIPKVGFRKEKLKFGFRDSE